MWLFSCPKRSHMCSIKSCWRCRWICLSRTWCLLRRNSWKSLLKLFGGGVGSAQMIIWIIKSVAHHMWHVHLQQSCCAIWCTFISKIWVILLIRDKSRILKIWVRMWVCIIGWIFKVWGILLIWDKWWKTTILHEIGPRILVVGVHWKIKCVEENF